MKFQRIHKSKSQSPQRPQEISKLRPEAFGIQGKEISKKPPTQVDKENQVLQNQKMEATKLEIQAKHGTITPEGQERLDVLQAKINDFWVQKRESSHFQPNLLEIPGIFTRRETRLAQQIQPQLTIGQPGDKYEQEANSVATDIINQIHQNQSHKIQRQEITEEELKDSQIPETELPESGNESTTDIQNPEMTETQSDNTLTNEIQKHKQEITDTLYKTKKQFTNINGEQHTLFIEGEGASAQVMMASDIQNLWNILNARIQIRQSPEQENLLQQGIQTTQSIINLIKVSDALITEKIALREDSYELPKFFQEKIFNVLKTAKLTHTMGVQNEPIPKENPLFDYQNDVDLELVARNFPKPGLKNRPGRLQVNALTNFINQTLQKNYAHLAQVLANLNPPLEEQRSTFSNTDLSLPPKTEQERDARVKKYLLPRTTFNFVSAPGSNNTIKAVYAEALNISDNRSAGSEPESGTDKSVAGYELLKTFGLTGKGPNWVRMHLISNKLGGQGIPENLVPGPHVKNQQMERKIEEPLKALVEKNQGSTNVLFLRVNVSYYSQGDLPMSDNAKSYAQKLNLSIEKSDFAQKITFEAGHSVWEGSHWQPDESTKISDAINLDLPNIKLPMAYEKQKISGKMQNLIKEEGEATSEINTLKSALDCNPLDNSSNRLKYLNDLAELLSLPETIGAIFISQGYRNQLDNIFIKLQEEVVTLSKEAEEINKLNNQPRRKLMGEVNLDAPKQKLQEAENLNQLIAHAIDKLAYAKGDKPIQLGNAPDFKLGYPLVARQFEMTAIEKKQAEDLEKMKQQLAQLQEELKIKNQLTEKHYSTKKSEDEQMAELENPRKRKDSEQSNEFEKKPKTSSQDKNSYIDGLIKESLENKQGFYNIGKTGQYDNFMKPIAVRLQYFNLSSEIVIKAIKQMCKGFYENHKQAKTKLEWSKFLTHLFIKAGFTEEKVKKYVDEIINS